MQRIKGQEVVLSFTDSNGNDESIGDPQDFEMTLMFEILQEDYLGETTSRFDDIFRGVSGSTNLHLEGPEIFSFTEMLELRSKRRSPAENKFTALSSFNFPSGQRARIAFEDIFFGEVTVGTGGRAEYVKVPLNWKCSNIRRIL